MQGEKFRCSIQSRRSQKQAPARLTSLTALRSISRSTVARPFLRMARFVPVDYFRIALQRLRKSRLPISRHDLLT